MNILIVGANGLLGRNLVDCLSKKHKVYACVRNQKEVKFITNQNVAIIQTDLSNFDISILPQNIDAIYYLAQSNRFREFPNGVQDMTEVNILTPIKIAIWGSENKVKTFIYTSTGGIYTQTKNLVCETDSIDISKINGFYPSSKFCAEALLKNFETLYETFIIARPFFMYGVGQTETMLIPRLIDNIQKNNPITLNGNEGIKINPIYVSDAVKAFESMLKVKGSYVFNIAGDEVLSLKDICLIIGNIISKEPLFTHNEQNSNDLIGNTELMKKHLCKPQISFKEGISKMVSVQ